MGHVRNVRLISFAVIALAACGDGETASAPDAGDAVDAGEADAAGECAASLESPEGGMVFLEYLTYSDAVATAAGLGDARSALRIISYFIGDMEPDRMPLPPVGECTNLVTSPGWPAVLGDDLVELDAGEVTISTRNGDGDPVELDIPLATEGAPASFPYDSVGRRHTGNYYERIAIPAEEFAAGDTAATVHLSGSGELDEYTGTDAVFIPAPMALSSPGLEDEIAMTAGDDFTVSQSLATGTHAPPGVPVLQVVTLVDPATGHPVILCSALESETEGSFTIPGSAIQSYRDTTMALGHDPGLAILVRNSTVHQVRRLENGDDGNCRRVNMVGVYCYVQFAATLAAPE